MKKKQHTAHKSNPQKNKEVVVVCSSIVKKNVKNKQNKRNASFVPTAYTNLYIYKKRRMKKIVNMYF